MSAHDDYLDPDRAGLNDEPSDNDHIKQAFADYEGPGQLYRSAYKYTACGPGVGVTIQEWVEDVAEEPAYELQPDGEYKQTGTQLHGGSKLKTRTLYCSDLYKLGTWEDMDKRGQLITQFLISSIVEGSGQDTSTHEVPALYTELEDLAEGEENVSNALRRLFWKAVDDTDKEANAIWNETHGCPTCAKHWIEAAGNWCEDDEPWLGEDDARWDVGTTPVWDECPECDGDGIII